MYVIWIMRKFRVLPLFSILVYFTAYAQNLRETYVPVNGNSISDIQTVTNSVIPYLYKNSIDLSGLHVPLKKELFIHLMLPSILIAKHEIDQTRLTVSTLIELNRNRTIEEETFLKDLLKTYKCTSNEELLVRLQTHPTSIVIAQAALESGWGTSRFYKQANNIFGVWSYSENEPRIKASETRDGKSVFVKKYETLPESFASYFKTLARGPYKSFRYKRTQTKDVFQLITHLKLYSELREEYIARLESLIRFNNLEQYDSYTLKVNTNE